MDGTPELLLVLCLAVVAGGGSAVFSRRADGEVASEPRSVLGVAALIALIAGGLVLRFGSPTGFELRARVAAALGGGALGVGCGFASAWGSERLGASDSPGGAARATSLSLVIAGASATVVVLCVGRGAPSSLDALVRALSAWAFGGVVASLAIGATDLFALAALAVSVETAAGLSARVPAAFGPLSAVLAAIVVSVGAASMQTDPDEAPDAPSLRGFAVATAVGTIAAASVGYWWARGPGAAVAALAASIGGVLTLLLGRYHDDPLHRPARSLADVRGMDTTARFSTGAIVGLEGFLAVSAIAALVALAAAKAGEISGAAGSGSAVAIATVLGSWAFLRVLARGEAARTLAHDTLLLALVAASFAHRSTFTAVAVAVAGLGLLVAAILERTAAAQPDPSSAGVLRGRAGTIGLLAALVLSGGATVASLLQ